MLLKDFIKVCDNGDYFEVCLYGIISCIGDFYLRDLRNCEYSNCKVINFKFIQDELFITIEY